MNCGKTACRIALYAGFLRRYYTTSAELQRVQPPQLPEAAITLPFKIPEPIERSPTELLEALASTVGVDVTAPHFAFIDDPAMIPSSNSRKIQYYMCKEFGKRAARQLAEEWPTLFMFDRDQPRLPVYRPEKPLDPLVVEANETNLCKMIASKQVEDAVQLYERIRVDGIDVSPKTTSDLFSLVCYYNGRNVPVDEFKEWHGLRNFHVYENKPVEENPMVELLFASAEKSSTNYSALICNSLKFRTDLSVIRAKKLFKEMIEMGYIPTEEVFNLFLSTQTSTHQSAAFDVLEEMREMARLGVRPSVRTFNAAILSTSMMIGDLRKRFVRIRSLLAEMHSCGISLNLTTMHHLILSSLKQHKFAWNVKYTEQELKLAAFAVDTSLNELAKWESIVPSEITDEQFFSVAMDVADHTANAALAERLESAYRDPKNRVVFRSFIPEGRFYASYLVLKLDNMKLEEFEDVYVSHIPRATSLHMKLALKILRKLKNKPIWSFLRRSIEDGIVVSLFDDPKIVSEWQNLLLNFPVDKLSELELDEFVELVNRLIGIWKDVNLLYDSQAELHERIQKEKLEKKDAKKSTEEKTEENEEDDAENQKVGENEAKERSFKQKPHIDFQMFESQMVERGILKVF